MIDAGGIDVLVEATGNPIAGIAHAKMAIAAKIHIVMVNVEADVLAGGILAKEAREAGNCLFNGLWRPTGTHH
jgi:predicted homoserine dehydrogenase-like protein